MKRVLIILMLLVGGSVAAPAATPTENRFIWEEANSRMAAATTEKDFLLAAQSYAKLANSGVRNGPLYYNLGVALLKAREYDQATAALLRAERYMGSNPEIRRNMLLALARDGKDVEPSLPWYRHFLFWHYGLSVTTRTTIAIVAFFVFWLALTLRALGAPRVARPLIGLALLLVALFGSSVATSLNQEANERLISPGSTVVAAPAASEKAPPGNAGPRGPMGKAQR